MRLVPMTADDEELAVRLECDPEMMRHIGGPRPEPDVRASLANAASNAIARKIGMKNEGEVDDERFGGVERCNDWRIDVRQHLGR